MKIFKFKGKTTDMKIKEGTIYAENQKEAIDKLSAQNLYVINCDETTEQEAKNVKSRYRTLFYTGIFLVLVGIIVAQNMYPNIGTILLISGLIIIPLSYAYALAKCLGSFIERKKQEQENNKIR